MTTAFPAFFKAKLKAASSPVAHTEEETLAGTLTQSIALQGDISIIAIEDVFQLFSLASLTGKLLIQSPVNNGTFYFKNGSLIHGLLQINPRKIGQILLDSQMITKKQLEECLLIHQQTGARQQLGQILLDKGYATPNWLNNSLLHQIKEAFFNILSWQEGTFKFYPNQVPSADEVQLSVRIDHLLLEGMAYIDQRSLGVMKNKARIPQP